MAEQEKLTWEVCTVRAKGALLRARREDVVFIIYYIEPTITHPARWILRIWDHGELMTPGKPTPEPQALMDAAEIYRKWHREL